ncbi:hypothetical protein [Chryseobacterium sp. c4a]|uniref:hypothetical protein n=1 Tax=Chryseobacterium sp. c4a TaxID=1573582 RepID=UPI00135C8C24|nr:hypothetical protein [Chryseobacterium sp. c4a]
MAENIKSLIKRCLRLQKRIEELEITIRDITFNDIISRDEFLKKYNLNSKTFDNYRKAGLKAYQPVRNGKIFVSLKEFEKFLKKK